jgi:O-antigen ligase
MPGSPVQGTPQPTVDPDRIGATSSLRERLTQSGLAWELFVSEPIFGTGLGYAVDWVDESGLAHHAFNTDTPLSFASKFGVVGLGILLFVLFVGAGFVRGIYRTSGWSVALVALLMFLSVGVAYSLLAVPMEDKGFSFGLILLVALSLTVSAGSPTDSPGDRR